MSMFLGPIHYWLYNKIGHQEELTRLLAEKAVGEGWISNADDYVRDLPALETVIDEENIHGWLQSRISDAEQRYADLVLAAAGQDDARLDALCETAFAFGREHALAAEATPEEAYKAFEDFFVNGMPCDHVNSVTESSNTSLSWEQTQELHADYWTSQGGNVNPYYRLRKSVMDGMLSACALKLSTTDKDHYVLEVA
ncbi:MAG: hypothetical protein ACI4D6_02790 [Chordicoccus sp.]